MYNELRQQLGLLSGTARFQTEDTYRGEKDDPLSLNLYAYYSGEPGEVCGPERTLLYHSIDRRSMFDRIAYSWNPNAICMDALMGFCTYAASAAYLYRPANNQGISVSEGAHCYDNSGSAAETTVNSGTVADGKIPADAAVTGQGSNGQTIGKQKTGPKPQGTGPHNVKIEEVASQIKDGEVIAGGGKFKEKAIPTVNGVKSSRRPDILVKKPDGSMYGINVGKTTAKGAPIKREVEAIYDLEGAGLPMYFVAYDKWRNDI